MQKNTYKMYIKYYSIKTFTYSTNYGITDRFFLNWKEVNVLSEQQIQL